MDASLDGKSFKIVSLIEGNSPIGVNHTKPSFQFVRVNGPVQNWVFRKVGERNLYRLSIGGYRYTGVMDGKVVASIDPERDAEWEITYQEHQRAYTITLARERHSGWTMPLNIDEGSQVQIRPIISRPSLPPQFLPGQLFRCEPVEE